jgi:adenine-specific DNA-methyltransferase
MTLNINLNPDSFNLPSEFADSLANIITDTKDKIKRQNLGQFFTPLYTARKFIEFTDFSFNLNTINICEPACGLGILSCVFIEKLCNYDFIKTINLTCFEIDSSITYYTNLVFNKLKLHCAKFAVELNFNLIQDDFILYYKEIFENNSSLSKYDVIISNPPFFKLSNSDPKVTLAKNILYGLPNIYTIFFYISTNIVKQEGALYFLIPRSFCSNSFFKQYREHFIKYIKFQKIHLFSAEDPIFDSHSVLYEFIFISAIKTSVNDYYNIKISHSESINSKIDVNFDFCFDINKNIIPLPASNEDILILKKLASHSLNLRLLNFSVHYSNLIITKVEKFLTDNLNNNSYPVIWLHNIESTKFTFPLEMKYHNYINYSKEIEQYLISNNNYIFFRRYNNNDYIRRIKATAYEKNYIQTEKLAIDRLVGVLINNTNDLPVETYHGLTAYLNSNTVNSYFRMINGIINVTGEMILDLPIPDIAVINKAGSDIKNGYYVNIDMLI